MTSVHGADSQAVRRVRLAVEFDVSLDDAAERRIHDKSVVVVAVDDMVGKLGIFVTAVAVGSVNLCGGKGSARGVGGDALLTNIF